MKMKRLFAGLMLAALAPAGIASAETIAMTGKFPAPRPEATFVHRIAIDRIGGVDGSALGFSLERALNSGGYFTIVVGGAPADAAFAGTVSTDVSERRVEKERSICTERVGEKCVKTKQETVICSARTIDMIADLRLADVREGRIIVSLRKTRHNESTRCEGDTAISPTERVVRTMVDGIAEETATELTPYTKSYELRLYESRDGLDKDVGARFKEAVRQVQGDRTGGCAAITTLDGSVAQFAIAYDAGICAEARGDYQAALALYQRAATLRPRETSDFTAGADRARRLIQRAEDDKRR